MTFDLDLDLKLTLDVRSPGDHRVQVWSQSTICVVEAICAKSLQTDGETDRETDDGRRAI